MKTSKPLYKDFMATAKSIIEAHYQDENFGCKQFCDLLKLNRSHVHKKLKAEANMSTSEFIKMIRLEKAMTLLKTSELNVSDIAYQVGFSDANYFSRLFSQQYGYPPSKAKLVDCH